MAPNLSKVTSTTTEVSKAADVGGGCCACSPPSNNMFALDGNGTTITVNGHPIFTEVPPNIVLTPSPAASKAGSRSNACFVGFDSDVPKSWHAVPLGQLRGIRFMSIFRFKVWWTTHWVGDKGRDIENETQIMMLDKSDDGGRPYVLLLPIVEGPFRSCLQNGSASSTDDNVELVVESGSKAVAESSFRTILYLQAGDDPYRLVKEAMKVAREQLGTFKLLEEKTPPGIVDKFGWCTWDAFYLNVHPEGVLEGVRGLVDGGCPPGLVLVDDGWQSICHDDDPITDQEGMNRTSAGEQMPCRLIKFGENYKFRDYKSKVTGEEGMGAFVKDMKTMFGSVEYVYVWHALCGYWGGLRPGIEDMPEAKLVKPMLTPGLEKTMEDLAVDKIVNNGVGLVAPEKALEMYEGLHSHLASVGIDGVKVDVIHLLEMLCEENGGRVELAKAYYSAISASVKKHFKGNGVIASMEHCNDFMFLGTETISLGRVGDDFWCTDPAGDPNGTFWLQGCHMVHCAFNSWWMGSFIHPDWDMFQSTHPCARFHAASRAISGGPIYVSDSVGKHNFPLLRSLVLPDGSLLRCDFYALPTRDCFFVDPLHSGLSILKIWNLNKFTGVLGAFNCQGGGWCRETRRNQCASEYSKPISCRASPNDIEWSNGNTPFPIQGVELFAVFSYQGKKLALLKPGDGLDMTLDPFDFELLTVSPVKTVTQKKVQFAPIGLANMLNTGGAIQSFEAEEHGDKVRVGVKGSGEMMAYSSEKPRACLVEGKEVEFGYDEEEKVVVVDVPWPNSCGLSTLDYLF